MSLDASKLQTNKGLETDGVWVTLQPGTRVKLARWENARMQNLLFERTAEYREAMAAGLTPDYTAIEAIQTEVMAEAVFLGFEGIEWDGKPLEDTLENRLFLLTEVRELRNMLVERAQRREYFLVKGAQRVVGNSPSSSNGKSSTGSMKSGSKRSKKRVIESGRSMNGPESTV